jgi:hypothetical protein
MQGFTPPCALAALLVHRAIYKPGYTMSVDEIENQDLLKSLLALEEAIIASEPTPIRNAIRQERNAIKRMNWVLEDWFVQNFVSARDLL